MVLPSFIGIGAERCGSTWLHLLLKQHPQVYMPEKRKELQFFDKNYHKGLKWYGSFFPDEQTATAYKAMGEITPVYLNIPVCAERIASLNSIQKFIVILRNPVNRAYSQYGHSVRLSNYRKSFEEYIIDHPGAIKRGLYAQKLDHYFKYFDKKQFCCLIFEESVNNVNFTKQKLAKFLEIEFDEFPDSAGLEKVNQTYLPKFKKLNEISSYVRHKLIDKDLDWLVNMVKVLGFQKVLEYGAKYTLAPMSPETKLRLENIFEQDIKNLEKLLDISLDIWRL